MNAVIDVKHDLQEVVKFWCDPIPDMDSVSHFALLTYLSHLRHAGCAPLSDTVYSICFCIFTPSRDYVFVLVIGMFALLVDVSVQLLLHSLD